MGNNFKYLPDSLKATENQINELVKINEKTSKFDLLLSKKDALKLFEAKKGALISNGRMELISGEYIISKIITNFYDSPYIHQSNYVETIEQLIDAFYYFKNETLDMMGDDEILEYMREKFDEPCRGSMELLTGKELEILSYCVKHNMTRKEYDIEFLYREEDDDYDE